MPSKKRAYLQQFGIIHLPNSDLTYIRNPERETKLYLCPSTSWKLKSGTLLCYLFLFSPSHLTRNHDANRAPRAYIYALEAGFSQVAKNYQVFWQTVGGVFLTFFPKIKDDNSICQTRCSNRAHGMVMDSWAADMHSRGLLVLVRHYSGDGSVSSASRC